MAGVKGRSGRKGYIEEMAIEEVLKLSTASALKYLKSPSVSDKDKAMFGQRFLERRIPDRKKQEVSHTFPQNKETQPLLDSVFDRSKGIVKTSDN